MLTKKHLEFIAATFREVCATASESEREVIRRVVTVLADAFDRQGRGRIVTPLFDRTRFLVKCGVRDPYPYDQPYYIWHFRSEEK